MDTTLRPGENQRQCRKAGRAGAGCGTAARLGHRGERSLRHRLAKRSINRMTDAVLEDGKVILAGWTDDAIAEANAFLAPDRPLDDLFGELGRQTLGDGAMRDDLNDAGKRIWRNMRELRGRICRDERLRAYTDANNAQVSDGLAWVAVVASVVQSYSSELNATLLAAIAVRIGLRTVCQDIS